ncbi:hypothetical protein ACFL1U_02180 [Patescibacteria group bacterium]
MSNTRKPSLPGIEPAGIKNVTAPSDEVAAVISGPTRSTFETTSPKDQSLEEPEEKDEETPDVSRHVHGTLEIPLLPFEKD